MGNTFISTLAYKFAMNKPCRITLLSHQSWIQIYNCDHAVLTGCKIQTVFLCVTHLKTRSEPPSFPWAQNTKQKQKTEVCLWIWDWGHTEAQTVFVNVLCLWICSRAASGGLAVNVTAWEEPLWPHWIMDYRTFDLWPRDEVTLMHHPHHSIRK